MIKLHNGQLKSITEVLGRLMANLRTVAERVGKSSVTKVAIGVPYQASMMH